MRRAHIFFVCFTHDTHIHSYEQRQRKRRRMDECACNCVRTTKIFSIFLLFCDCAIRRRRVCDCVCACFECYLFRIFPSLADTSSPCETLLRTHICVRVALSHTHLYHQRYRAPHFSSATLKMGSIAVHKFLVECKQSKRAFWVDVVVVFVVVRWLTRSILSIRFSFWIWNVVLRFCWIINMLNGLWMNILFCAAI